jgi:DNA primase RepB-like protein/AAA domain-containing protein
MSAFESYQQFIHALYAPNDVIGIAVINPKSGAVQHTFVEASKAETREYFDALVSLNENFNIYAGMNPFKPELIGQNVGRTKENVAAVKRVYVDADENGGQTVDRILKSEKVPQPTVVLESSPNKYQLIWNTAGLTRETAEPLMRALADEFGTDKAVAEVARVLRIPGFRNLKYSNAPEVKLVSINAGANYDSSAFRFDFKPEENSEPVRQERPLIPHGQIHLWLVARAGKLRESGLTPEEIDPILQRMAHAECELPLDKKKITQVAMSMGNYEQGQDKSLLLTQGLDSQPAEITPELLDKEFPAYDGTEPDGLPMLIEGFMPKGVGFFGSLSGTGKTWCGLSVAKALSSGTPLWSVFPVKKQTAILYLVPEASDASFKRRLMKMRITQDRNLFRYRTITQGITRPLSDPMTVAMIQQLSTKHDVLVIVDTAVRFFRGGDENAAKENNLVQDSDMLRSLGANVLFLHHSPKATKDAAELTLENVLRGSGDFGAMSDFVYGFRRDEKMFAQGEGPEEIEVVCVKPRDFEPPLPFRLQLKRKAKHGEPGPIISVIDQIGDLAYIGHAAVKDDHSKMLASIFHENPFVSFNDLVILLKMKRELVRGFCKRNGGWKQVEEVFAGSRGRAGKRKRWTQGLVMQGQVEQTGSAPDAQSSVVPSGASIELAANTVTFEDASVGF